MAINVGRNGVTRGEGWVWKERENPVAGVLKIQIIEGPDHILAI